MLSLRVIIRSNYIYFSKVNCPYSSLKSESSTSFALDFLFVFSALAKSDSVSMLSYLLSAKWFLTTTNLTRSPTPPQADGQVSLIYLNFSCITLHEFILCQGMCRGKVGLLILFFDLGLSSSSEGLVVQFSPLTLDEEAVWWIVPYWLDFY